MQGSEVGPSFVSMHLQTDMLVRYLCGCPVHVAPMVTCRKDLCLHFHFVL